MRKSGLRIWITAMACLGATLSAAPATEDNSASGFLILSENDLYCNFFGYKNRDRHYTQGLKLMYIGSEQDFQAIAARLNRWVPKLGLREERCSVGFALGQNIYTPSDIDTAAPIPGDQPYAGWLYGSLLFQRRGLTGNRVPTLDSFELALGVVGPASLAAATQRQWHRWIRSDLPNGWENQLKNEPTLELKYARYWRLTPNEHTGRYFDFVPHIGADLGNVRMDLNAGVFLRLGYNLPQDFGVNLIDDPAPAIPLSRKTKSSWFSCYAFVGAEGRMVARDIFLDGNSFADSLSVDKKNAVGDFLFGGGLLLFHHLEASFTGVIRSSRFENQPGGRDAYGSIMLKAIFSI